MSAVAKWELQYLSDLLDEKNWIGERNLEEEDGIPCQANEKKLVKLLVKLIMPSSLQGEVGTTPGTISSSGDDDGCGTTRMNCTQPSW